MDQLKRLHKFSMDQNTSKKEIYNIWSFSYDSYVSDNKYTGPSELVDRLAGMIMNFHQKNIEVLDFGCGTGLVGHEIKKKNLPVDLDGVDISPQMLVKAGEKACYENLYEKNLLVDSIFLPHQKLRKKYEIIISCGVFLEGHAPLEVIENLLDHLHIEGFILFTIRSSYKEKESEKFSKYVMNNLRVKVIESTKINYLQDVDCEMYLLYRIC